MRTFSHVGNSTDSISQIQSYRDECSVIIVDINHVDAVHGFNPLDVIPLGSALRMCSI